MISFTLGDFFASVLMAMIYGALCSLFLTLHGLINSAVKFIISLPEKALFYEKNIKIIKLCGQNKLKQVKELTIIIKIVSFTIGYILLSYYSLDGEIRLYMLAVSLLSFYVINKLFQAHILSLLEYFSNICASFIIKVSRIITYPVYLVVNSIIKRKKDRIN